MATLYRCETCGYVTESMVELGLHMMDHAQPRDAETEEPGRPLP